MFAVAFVATVGLAQEGLVSPYSYYGIGVDGARGTVENQSMGGLSILGDSIHTNLLNPAGYGALRLTNFTLGLSHRHNALSTADESGSVNSSTIDYLSLAFPVSKRVGVGFGLMPFTSVDYKVIQQEDDFYGLYRGEGGINQVFLTAGAEIFKGFRIGASAKYNFGRIRNQAIEDAGGAYALRELNQSDLSGLLFDFGLQYEKRLASDYFFTLSGNYTLEGAIESENSRQFQTGQFSRIENELISVIEDRAVELANTQVTTPARYGAGAGFGKKTKWFFGGEYNTIQASSFVGRPRGLADTDYRDANQYRVGGYYIPRFNSISSYWGRVTYSAGLRYEETGLYVNNEGVDEFGISFGLGLPLNRRTFSNINLLFEYGQRGTTASGLIQEDIFKFGLSLSLNAKWFQPFKFN